MRVICPSGSFLSLAPHHNVIFRFYGFILRDASLCDAPQDEVPDPHGEEHGNAVRLEP
jgi:hypothetical protein